MDFIGFDLGKTSSQVCIITEGGEFVEHRIRTDREQIARMLAGHARAPILIEASTESVRVARSLEDLEHEVVVADTNSAPLCATRSRVKTDKRDARTLAEACRPGASRPPHLRPPAPRPRATRRARAMPRTRSRYISLVGTLLRRDGFRLPSGAARNFLVRLEALEFPANLLEEVAPLLAGRRYGRRLRVDGRGERREVRPERRRGPGSSRLDAPGGDDPWLALDRDGNGTVDNGPELFGDFTPQPPSPSKNGFLALAEYDKPALGGNSDGVIDSRDAVFANLRLWTDANHNGVSEPAELRAMPAHGLSAVELRYAESKRTDEHGNRFRYRAKVGNAKGSKVGRLAWDVYLVLGQ